MNTNGGPTAALGGLKVLDLSRVRAGPTCVRVLADFGADVIKIEAPAGVDPNEGMSGARDGYDMLNLHRNKRCMTLNIKSEEGRRIFLKLVEQADVVVENFRPDVKDRLEIGYEALAKVNPRIVLASISGYGQSGPYRTRGGFDQIAQGMGGLMWLTGLPGQGPVRAGIALADSSAGLYAAIGILIALREREVSGRGQWIHTSLLEAQIAMLDFQAARYLVDGVVPPQAGNDHPYVTPMGVFRASDGFINIGVAGEGLWKRFCEAIGCEDLAADSRFLTDPERLRNKPALYDILSNLFATKPAEHWLDALERAGVPAGPIYKMDEMFNDPQVEHLEMAKPVDHPDRGQVRLVRQPLNMSRTPAQIRNALPDLGFHTGEILNDLGYDAATVEALRQNRVI
jgi:crotonobetainyl-CoA:carnitine CoA-transferase CaiB-like acyl-CoA transferase